MRVRQTEIEFVISERINFKHFIFGEENNFLGSALGINSSRENFRAVVDENFHAGAINKNVELERILRFDFNFADGMEINRHARICAINLKLAA